MLVSIALKWTNHSASISVCPVGVQVAIEVLALCQLVEHLRILFCCSLVLEFSFT